METENYSAIMPSTEEGKGYGDESAAQPCGEQLETEKKNLAIMPSIEEGKRLDLIARLKPRERNEKRFTCIKPKINISEFPALKDRLPDSYSYHVCDYKTIRETCDQLNFRATVRMALSTVDEIKLWLKAHTITWRVDRTVPGKGLKVIFKVDYRCQHNTRPRGIEKVPGKGKNTNCPARMSVTLLRTQVSRGRQSRSTDPHLPAFPTTVNIISDHNHDISVADALRHGDVGDKTKERLKGSRQASAAGFAEMCQELTAIVNSDPSFSAASVAAVKAFKKIKDNPSKIITALRMFGRDTNTGLASVRSKAGPAIHAQPTAVARRRVCLGGKRRLTTGRPTKVVTGPDHVNGQSD